MTEPLSVYLDLVRFIAASVVLVAHIDQDDVYNGAAPFGRFAHVAVMIFFVLSGLVIAHTAIRPSETLRKFVIARVARISSVSVPALILSFAIISIVAALEGGLEHVKNLDGEISIATFLRSMFFLNESWTNFENVPWNNPYWSLCYEVWYYGIFAGWFFCRGWTRLIVIGLAAAIAGPRVLALFPIWLFGVWAIFDARFTKVPVATAAIAFAASLAGILLINLSGVDVALRLFLYDTVPGWWRLGSSQGVITDLIIGVLVLANFVSFRSLGQAAAPIVRLTPIVRWLASYTFSIYLFHRPITMMLSHYSVSAGDDHVVGVLICLGVFGACGVLGQFTEKKKHYVSKAIGNLWPASGSSGQVSRRP